MGFQTRQDFIDSEASEKITLAWVEGVERLYTWTLHSGNIYKKTVSYFTIGLNEGATQLVEVTDLGSIVQGSWYYDSLTSTIYVENLTSSNPQIASEMIVKYRFFFGNKSVTASWDMLNTGNHVQYAGRIKAAPGYKHKIGIEQGLVSLVGGGSLVLQNNDSELDDIFDTIIFENKNVTIFSWNDDLDFEDKRVIFKGIINQKSYDGTSITFDISDQLFALEQELPQNVYTDSDNVDNSIKGRAKRWIYGKVQGLKLQSIDQISDGYNLTGTVSVDVTNRLLVGVGTNFINELSIDDSIIIDTQEFKVTTVESATQATLNDVAEFSVAGATAQIKPEIPVITKNRTFFVADHATARVTKTVVSIIQFNRVKLNDIEGLESGDYVEFTTGERIEIKNVAPNNVIVLRKNLVQIPSVGSNVSRQPIQRIFVESSDIPDDDFTISNTSTQTTVTLASDVEFNLARTQSIGLDLTFTNGSRNVQYLGSGEFSLKDIVSPRDYLRPTDITYSTYYEVLSVGDGYTLTGTITTDLNSTTVTGTGTLFTSELSPGDVVIIGELQLTVDTITNDTTFELADNPEIKVTNTIGRIAAENYIELRTTFADPTHAGPVESKSPNYIGDNTILSADVLGRTIDNTPDGQWLRNASQVTKDLISQSGITEFNTGSFDDGAAANNELVSLMAPISIDGGSTKIKELIDKVCRSTFSSITLDNDLNIKFKALLAELPDNTITIKDDDVIDWKIRTVNRKNVRNVVVNYRHQDVGRSSLEASNLTERYENEFVDKYIGTSKTEEIDLYLYNTQSASIMSHRIAFYNSLSRADLTIKTDLRLENIEIGDTRIIDFRRMYKRFGDSTSRKKAFIVVGKIVDGKRITFELTDMGNIFNRVSIITPNSAPDYSTASEDEKLKYGFITDNNGITDDDEQTDNVHLIT